MPVIAAVDGHCIGGAVDVVTACDLRYCSASAVFCVKEVDLAMVADIGTLQRLPFVVGEQRAKEMAYTGTSSLHPAIEYSVVCYRRRVAWVDRAIYSFVSP